MKKWTITGDKRWTMLLDAVTEGALCAAVYGIFHNTASNAMQFAGLITLYGLLVFIFMIVLDEYKFRVYSMYEKGVIFVLSSIYSFVIAGLAIPLCMKAHELILPLAVLGLMMMVGLFIENLLATIIKRKARAFAKPKLLVIETNNTDVKRVRRIKYGALGYCDAWYESLDTSSSEDLNRIIDTELDKYDAVCLLDSVDVSIYDKLVKAVLERRMELFVVPQFKAIGISSSHIHSFDDVMALQISGYQLSHLDRFLKRVTDIVFAVLMIAVTIIPMGIIALAVKLTSPGPVIYKQVRLTKDHKEFNIMKFRTMVQDAEKLTGPTMAQKNDARITSVGKYLRACRLDELPQLFNILMGDMSVVGPRPERPMFVEQFEKELDFYSFRYNVKAGLTGLSHVYGRYSTYTYDRTCFDLMYITNYSYLLDIKIMLLTSKIMFMKSAAEGDDEFKLEPDRPIENLSSRHRSQNPEAK